MDGPLLTAFVDRQRLETHTFHLPSGEMSVLMQDVGYILGLCLDGPTVIGTVEPVNWKDMVEQFTGHRPLDPKEGKKEKKALGVSSAWLRQRFNMCPPHALDDVVERYARVWLWHMVAQFLFPDASGNTVSWMVLP
jgi:methyl coenzyme M reductase subunit C